MLKFYQKSKDKTGEEFEETFLHWVKTDILPLDRMTAATRHDPVLSRITSRIRKKNIGILFDGWKTLERNKP